ncbi:N-acetyllactosaminide beta-1,3-N-acetylglucosaminyltransferase 2-like [Alosa pseudoharengus]|uniref:N-acetyllactosaminide beta-1,3-N-acetylglucosaminyltransferase 2-like n=1 Tax=Alosa pseudoharengus TaxID=34774 RepID=UPI003F89FC66
MARCCCNSRVLCLCLLPCMMMGHLLIYILVSIFVTIAYNSSQAPPPLPLHFVAPGASKNSVAVASHPLGTFWNLRLQDGALWNRLQHQLDRRHNPILRARRRREGNGTLGGGVNGATGGEACEWRPQGSSQLPDFDELPQQMKDFVLSMDCRTYPLLMDQPHLCEPRGPLVGPRAQGDAEQPTLLMAIKSQVGNFESRQAIRETWGRSGWVSVESAGGGGGRGGLVRTVFLLGRQDSSTGPHPNLNALLELESHRHGDILQWDFRDTFFNLTLKDVLFWDWFGRRCPDARFVFKGDDDVFVRTGPLLDYLLSQTPRTLPTTPNNNNINNEINNIINNNNNATQAVWDFLVGDVISHAWPNRQPETKYFIPESFYVGVYPAYAGGGGVVYSGWLARRFREVSRQVHLFPIDDVYLGMCLRRLGLSPTHHPGFMTFDLPEGEREKPCAYRNVMLVHKRSPRQMLMLWRQLREALPTC